METPDHATQTEPQARPQLPTVFDPNQTQLYQARLRWGPHWLHTLLASNNREKERMRVELGKIRGALPLLMKVRNGEKWSAKDKAELKRILRSASSVSPYLLLWALPGSLLLLPFLAWHLDARRKKRE